MSKSLSDRQLREIDYHRSHAAQNENRRESPVGLDVVTSKQRRWWNAYWSTYDILLKYDWTNKRVLVPGCGFGEDAVRISQLGAEVYAFDISPDILEIARDRCKHFGYERIHFNEMPAEALKFDNDFFDLVFCLDILHHIDIPKAVAEFKRVLKSDGRIIGDELYTHSLVEKAIRKNRLVDKVIYPKMVHYIYGKETPYITEDEHKINEEEFNIITDNLDPCHIDFFNIAIGRLFSDRSTFIAKCDRGLAVSVGRVGRLLAGRVIFDGRIRK